MRVNWIGQSARYTTRQVSDLRLVNAYAEMVESKQGRTVVAIKGTPGLRLFTTIGGGVNGVRGLYAASNDRCFAVRGNVFVELFSDGTVTQRGSLVSLAGPVAMADNRLHLMLVDGANGYIFTFSTNGFAQIVDPDFPGATRVGFVDNYLVFPQPDSQQFGWTDLLSTEVDPLNFASAEGAPDRLVSQVMIHREIWNLGASSTEIFYNTGDADSPFARIAGAFLEQGCAAAHAPAVVGETLCWLSRNDEGHGMVLQASGYTAQRISTHPVEEALQGYAVLDDALGWGQQWQGHLWYVLCFPAANATWVFDTTTGLWHEWAFLNPATGMFERHRANCHAFMFGKHLVGDYADGRVYEMRADVYTDDTQALRREAVLPPVFDAENLRRVFHTALEIYLEVGIGLDGSPAVGADPMLLVSWSNDGGQTWGNERQVPMGKMGEYRRRARLYQLGSARDRRYKIAMSEPCRFTVLGATVEVEVGGA